MISESERIDRYLASQVWLDALRAWRRPRPEDWTSTSDSRIPRPDGSAAVPGSRGASGGSGRDAPQAMSQESIEIGPAFDPRRF